MRKCFNQYYSFVGEHHVSQFCSNSKIETWWKGEGKPCVDGKEGGFKCACSESGYIVYSVYVYEN